VGTQNTYLHERAAKEATATLAGMSVLKAAALASVTAPIVNLAANAVGTLGLAGVGLLMASSGVIGIPGTEPTMLFAGFDAFKGTLSLPGIIVVGVLGDVLGAAIAYAIGRRGGRELVERRRRKLHSTERLERSSRWFERYGSGAVLFSRIVPVVRSAFAYAAGVARMPARRFVVLTTLGSIPWVTGLAVLGREVGRNWANWRHHLDYVDYVGAVIVALAVIYLLLHVVRERKAPRSPAVNAASE
jgi:membrane protein DedA with SNARE-associated domain